MKLATRRHLSSSFIPRNIYSSTSPKANKVYGTTFLDMPLRPATRADIPVMGKIFAAAFAPDSLFHVLFPYKAEHPEGFERAAREVFWYHWYDYRMVHILSYQLVDDNEQSDGDERSALLPSGKKRRQKEIITGVAQWERTGKGWEKLYGILGWWDPRESRLSFCIPFGMNLTVHAQGS